MTESVRTHLSSPDDVVTHASLSGIARATAPSGRGGPALLPWRGSCWTDGRELRITRDSRATGLLGDAGSRADTPASRASLERYAGRVQRRRGSDGAQRLPAVDRQRQDCQDRRRFRHPRAEGRLSDATDLSSGRVTATDLFAFTS